MVGPEPYEAEGAFDILFHLQTDTYLCMYGSFNPSRRTLSPQGIIRQGI